MRLMGVPATMVALDDKIAVRGSRKTTTGNNK